MDPLSKLDHAHVWHPFTQMSDWLKREPIVITRGKGAVLEDQHGATGTIDDETRQVLFTRDMDAGDVVKAALAHDGAALLAAGGTVYVADISGMPSLVRRLFALPKMRKRENSMVPDTDGEATRRIPGKSGSATLIGLDGLKITSLRYLADIDELKATLGVSE